MAGVLADPPDRAVAFEAIVLGRQRFGVGFVARRALERHRRRGREQLGLHRLMTAQTRFASRHEDARGGRRWLRLPDMAEAAVVIFHAPGPDHLVVALGTHRRIGQKLMHLLGMAHRTLDVLAERMQCVTGRGVDLDDPGVAFPMAIETDGTGNNDSTVSLRNLLGPLDEHGEEIAVLIGDRGTVTGMTFDIFVRAMRPRIVRGLHEVAALAKTRGVLGEIVGLKGQRPGDDDDGNRQGHDQPRLDPIY